MAGPTIIAANLAITQPLVIGGGVVPWRPDYLGSSLQAWLDASEGSTIAITGSGVSSWKDRSQYGRSASQSTDANRPTVAGGGIRFGENTTQQLLTTGYPSGSYDFIFAGKTNTVAGYKQALAFNNSWWSLAVDDTGKVGVVWPTIYQAGSMTWANNTAAFVYGRINTTVDPFMAMNGGSWAECLITSTLIQINQIGGRGDGFFQTFGDVYELIFVPYESPDITKQQLEGYIAWKWNMVASLPAGHPYKSAAPTITYSYPVLTARPAFYPQNLIVGSPEVGKVPWVLPGAAIDLDWQNNRYYGGAAQITCTRSTGGYAKNSSGALVWFGANTPRITDLGLFVEQQRTNALPYTDNLTSIIGGWAGTAVTRYVAAGPSPDPFKDATIWIPDTTAANHRVSMFNNTIGNNVFSIFAKAAGYNYVVLQLSFSSGTYQNAVFDLTTGTLTAITGGNISALPAEQFGNGWWRFAVKGTATLAEVAAIPSPTGTPAFGAPEGDYYFTGAGGTTGVYLWGAQVEQANVAGSYFPNSTSGSATRPTDDIAVTSVLSTTLDGAACSVVLDVQQDVVGLQQGTGLISQAGGATTWISTSSGSAFQVTNYDPTPGIMTANIGNSLTWSLGCKVGFSLDSLGRSLVGGGGTVVTDPDPPTSFTPKKLGIATGGQGTRTWIRRLTAFSSRLSDAQLQIFTVPGQQTLPAIGQKHALVTPTLAVGSPVLGAPVAWTPAQGLVAANLAATAPVLGTANLKIIVLLSSANLATAPPVEGAALLGHRYALAPTAFGPASPAFTSPDIGQVHVFATIPKLVVQTEVGASTLGQAHKLTASNLAVTALNVPSGTLKQLHDLEAVWAPAQPVLAVAVLRQQHVLDPDGFTVTPPVIDVASFNQIATLAAVSVTVGIPTIATAAFLQAHAIAATPVEVPSPSLGVGILGLTAEDFVTGSPVLGERFLGQKHVIVALPLSPVPPSHSAAVIGQAGVMAAIPIAVLNPTIGLGVLAQKHVLAAGSLPVSSPELDVVTLVQEHILAPPLGITVGAPTIPVAPFGQAGVMAAVGFEVGPPVIGAPIFGQTHSTVATSFATSVPTLGSPQLGLVLSAEALAVSAPVLGPSSLTVVLAATPLSAGSPVLGTPVLTKAITATGKATSAPTLGAPAFKQAHVLTGSITIGSPVLPVPTLGIHGVIIAVPLAAGAPVLGNPTLAIPVDHLAPSSLVVGSPQLPVLAIGVSGAIAAVALKVAVPVLAKPALGQVHVLTGNSIAVAPPAFGIVAFNVRRNLDANGLDVSAPQLGQPSLTQFQALRGVWIPASPVIGESALGQVHRLTAVPTASGRPSFGLAFLGQTGVMAMVPLWVQSPVLGGPLLKQRHVLSAAGLSVAPVLGIPVLVPRLLPVSVAAGNPALGVGQLGQVQVLAASGLNPYPILGVPGLGQAHGLVAVSLASLAPVIPAAVLHERNSFTCNTLAVGNPDLGQPTVTTNYDFGEPWSVRSGRPVIAPAVLGQVHVLSPQNLISGPPRCLPATLYERETFQPVSLAVSATITGTPVLAVVPRLTAVGLAPRPVLDPAHLGQEHHLSAFPLAGGRPSFGRPVIDRWPLDAVGIVTSPPILGVPSLARIHLHAVDITGRRPDAPLTGKRGTSILTGKRAGADLTGQRNSNAQIIGRRPRMIL